MKHDLPLWVRTVSLTAPSLRDNTADAERLIQAIRPFLHTSSIDIDLDLLKILPKVLRESRFRVHCVLLKKDTGGF